MTDEPTPKAPTTSNALRRMEVILQDLTGKMTATEAATVLGVSRKVYYEWRERALQGLKTALEDRPPGRPAKEVDAEGEALRKKVLQLEADLKTQKLALIVQKELGALQPLRPPTKPAVRESMTDAKKKQRDES